MSTRRLGTDIIPLEAPLLETKRLAKYYLDTLGNLTSCLGYIADFSKRAFQPDAMIDVNIEQSGTK